MLRTRAKFIVGGGCRDAAADPVCQPRIGWTECRVWCFGTNAALRLTAAYQTGGILGIRGRFFNFETTGNERPGDFFDVRSFDLEATTDLAIKNWNLTAFGGVRWTDIDTIDGRFGGGRNSFSGFGATFGVDVKRAVGNGFALVGGVRQSFLLGETSSAGSTIDNVIVPITEFRFGDFGYVVRAESLGDFRYVVWATFATR